MFLIFLDGFVVWKRFFEISEDFWPSKQNICFCFIIGRTCHTLTKVSGAKGAGSRHGGKAMATTCPGVFPCPCLGAKALGGRATRRKPREMIFLVFFFFFLVN